MPVRGMYIDDARFVGKSCRLKVSNFVPNELSIIIDNGPATAAYGLQIKNVKDTLLPILMEMYPEKFGSKASIEIMDRIDQVCLDEKKKLGPLLSDEYKEGFEACRSVMQDEMNLIEDELKEGWNKCLEKK